MAVIKQLKGLWGVMGTLRGIADIFGLAPKAIREAVNRVMEVIGMGTVEEKRAFDRVIGSFRKITTGSPREPAREEERRQLPAPAQEEAEAET